MLNDWWFTELFDNATPIEIIWTTVGFFGLIYAVINCYRALQVLVVVDDAKSNGVLRMAAQALAIQQALSVVTFVLFLTIGIIATVFSPGEVGGRIISWMIVLAMFTVVAKTYYTKRSADKVIEYEATKGG